MVQIGKLINGLTGDPRAFLKGLAQARKAVNRFLRRTPKPRLEKGRRHG